MFKKVILYIRGRKTAPLRVRMERGRSVFRSEKPRALARGASLILFLVFIGMPICFASDRIVAVVNSEVITQSELDAYSNMIIWQLAENYKGGELEQRIGEAKKDLLVRMVEDRIIIQEARRQGLEVRQDRLKEQIEDMKTGFSGEADFKKALKEKGLTVKDLEDRLTEQILMREIIKKEVRGKIFVSPDEITRFYIEHKDEFSRPELRVIESFYFKDEALGKKLIEEAKGGADFPEIAAKYNDVIYSKDTVSTTHFIEDVSDEIFLLQANELTEPIRAGGGFYIFRLVEIVPPKVQDLIEAHQRIADYLFQQKFALDMSEWLQDLKANSYIEFR